MEAKTANKRDMSVKPLPTINDSIEYAGPSRVRGLTAFALHQLDHLIVLQERGEKLAVVVPYEQFMAMQRLIQAAEGVS